MYLNQLQVINYSSCIKQMGWTVKNQLQLLFSFPNQKYEYISYQWNNDSETEYLWRNIRFANLTPGCYYFVFINWPSRVVDIKLVETIDIYYVGT